MDRPETMEETETRTRTQPVSQTSLTSRQRYDFFIIKHQLLLFEYLFYFTFIEFVGKKRKKWKKWNENENENKTKRKTKINNQIFRTEYESEAPPEYESLKPGVVNHLRKVYSTLASTSVIAAGGTLITMFSPLAGISPIIPGLLSFAPLLALYYSDYRTSSQTLRMGYLASFAFLGGKLLLFLNLVNSNNNLK